MKKSVITLVAIALWMGAFGQEYYRFNSMSNQWDRYSERVDEAWINKIFQNAPLIFEGEITGSKQFLDTVRKEGEYNWEGNRYTLFSVDVNNVLRGSINKGTIAMLDPTSKRGIGADSEFETWWEGEPEVAYISPSPDLAKRGIYFCKASEKMPSGKEYSISLKGDGNSVVAVKSYYFIDLGKLEFDIGRMLKIRFSSKSEVYEFLGKYENIAVPENMEAPEPEKQNLEEKQGEPKGKKKDVSGSLNVISKENQIKYAKRVKSSEKYMEYLLSGIAIVANKTGNNCKEPFISEMIEGNGQNRALELFNPSDSAIDLSNYSIRMFLNGQLTPLIIPLIGTLPPKSTFVIAHPAASNDIKAKADMLSPQMSFDGNDAIVLEKNGGTQIDKIGEIGVNPGNSGWFVPPSGSTKEQTLRRKYPVDKGETDWNQGKNQWTVHPKDSVSNLKQHQNVCGTTTAVEDISFSFANPIETGTTPKYFEFDLMVNGSSNNTYFENAVIELAYNTSAFGIEIAANNKVTVTRSGSYNSATYIDPDTMITDASTSVIKIPFGAAPNAGTWNRTLVTVSSTQMLHVKIEMLNCGLTTDISFSNTFFNPLFSRYTTTAGDNPSNFIGYDNTNYSGDLIYTLCPPPVINSFTSPVYPGNWYQGTVKPGWELVIQGQNFEATRGNGNVYFIDGNKPTATYPYTLLDGSDFLLWTDNEIRIKVPSIINDTSFKSKTPSSGIFYVKNNSGDSVLSSFPIDMPYGIRNIKDGNLKRRMELANLVDDSTGIVFKLGVNINTYPDPMVEVIVRRSVKEWACNTLANFLVDSTYISIDTSAKDEISVIFFSDSIPDRPTALAVTRFRKTVRCLSITGDSVYYPKDIDIQILKDPTTIGTGAWYIDTSGALPANRRDFYEVVLHEVGHANLLKHVNDINSLMYWTSMYSTSAPIPESNRRWIAANDADGGVDVVDKSVSTVLGVGCAKSATYVSGSTCEGTTISSIRTPKQEIIDFIVYPNPIGNNGFNVSYQLARNSYVQFRLYNYMGKEIKRYSRKVQSKGSYQERIEVNNLVSGLYFLVVNVNEQMRTFKVIKM